jgi:hypothetical protein
MRARHAHPASPAPARSEIAGNTSYFPIAVAHRLGTVAAIDFLASRGLIRCAGAAALFGLGERPTRRLAEFAAARAGNPEATCLVFRPLHLHPPGGGGKSGANPHAPGFHSRRILAHMLGKVQLFVLEHVPKKLLDFFDQDILQLIDVERFLFDHMIPCDREAL